MVKIYLMRHGETYFNLENRIAGQIETELTDVGKEQVLQTALDLKKNGVVADVILCSTLKRARDTAGILSKHIKAPIEYFDELQEISCGDLEGAEIHNLSQIKYNPPYESAGFVMHDACQVFDLYCSTDPVHDGVAPPNGETKAVARNRFMGAIKEYIDSHPDVKNVFVVAHRAVIRFALLKVCPKMVERKIKNAEARVIFYDRAKGFCA